MVKPCVYAALLSEAREAPELLAAAEEHHVAEAVVGVRLLAGRETILLLLLLLLLLIIIIIMILIMIIIIRITITITYMFIMMIIRMTVGVRLLAGQAPA